MEDIKALFTRLTEITKELFKKVVNTYRIPSLIDLIIKPWKEALDNAKPASENWNRLGLERTWKYFMLLIVVLLSYLFKDSLQLAIEFILVVALVITGYSFYKSFK